MSKDKKLTSDYEHLKLEKAKQFYIKKTLQISYPQLSEPELIAYSALLYEYCERKYPSVSFIKIAAIIDVESRWDPTLVSSAKCRGIGQLSPAAAKEGCDKLGIKYKEGYTEWIDPLNLALAMEYYCSRAIQKGDSFAIRSYIGGDTWQKAPDKSERKQYIDKYVKMVESKENAIRMVIEEIRKMEYIYKGVTTTYAESLCVQK